MCHIAKMKKYSKIDINKGLIFIGTVLVYRILLDLIYKFEISPLFDYQNMVYQPTFVNVLNSWILLVICTVLVYPILRKKDFFIPNFCLLLFCIRFVPVTSIIAYVPTNSHFIFAQYLFWILLFSLLTKDLFSKKYINNNNTFILFSITFVMIMSVLLVSGLYTGFRIDSNVFRLDFTEVYEMREEGREIKAPTLLLYLWSAAANVLPVLLVYFLDKKKYIFVCIIAFTILINFSIDGTKSTIFKLLICIFFYYILKENPLGKILYLLITLCIFSLCEYLTFETTIISSLIVRRVMFVPAFLDTCYFDFIESHSPLLFQRTYQGLSLKFVIGDIYFGSSEMGANNGMFSDAFMHFGYLGCVLYPFVYFYILNLCKYAFKGVKVCVVFFASFIFVWNLMSSEITVALLTHGLFLLSLTLLFLPKSRINEKENSICI